MPQFSSKVVQQQVSFGDEPKTLTSIQKNILKLDQIVEDNDSPVKTAKKQDNLLSTGKATSPKPLQKQPTYTKLNINVPLPTDKKDALKEDGGQDLKSQQTIKLADFAQKPNVNGGQFNNLSIPKKSAEVKAPGKDKMASLFDGIASFNLSS